MTSVISLSGGMDSATLLGVKLQQGADVHCCLFTYGSKHNLYEQKAAFEILTYYQNQGYSIQVKSFDLTNVFLSFKSALLLNSQEIPEGHYNDLSMKQTVVPGRNLIFLSILASYAESIGADEICLGIHSGDHFIYPDCRPAFLINAQKTVFESTEGKVRVSAPFIDLTKKDILSLGYRCTPTVPYHLTRTCYKNQINSCGKCGSCTERLEAFASLNIIDPIKYDD